MNFKTLIFSLFVLFIVACGTPTSETPTGAKPIEEKDAIEDNHQFDVEYFNGDDYITYTNLGQPLPPSYYKKYTFKVSIDEIELTIGNYKETLASEKKPLSEKELSSIIEKIKSSRMTKCDKTAAKGCSGGYTEDLDYKIANVRFYGNIYTCGGTQYGNVCGNPKEFREFLKTFFPNFDKLMKG